MWALILGLALLGIVLAWVGWDRWSQSHQLTAGVLVPLMTLGVLGVLLRERSLGQHLGVSVATVVLAAAIPLVGPVGAALVGFFSYVSDVRARTWRTRLFNAAMSGAVGAVGGVTYILLGGDLVQNAQRDAWPLLLQVALPLVGAYVVMTLGNALAVAAMSAIVRGTPLMLVTMEVLRGVGWGYLSHVVVSFLFVVLWGPANLGTVAAFFVLGPLLVAHWTMGREFTARREHQETVTSFVSALEEAEPASIGHSARVTELAEAVAGQLGLGSRATEQLRYAALLHDVGLVAVRAEIPPDRESDEITYLTALSGHPDAGAAALRGLSFLSGALPAIRHHHERWDGHGYPAGLAGTDIPQAARIIAVADAYDALTASLDGPALGPAEALAALRQRAGTQLDPEVVEALETALARRRPQLPEPATRRPVRTGPRARALPDHDLPEVSDAFAHWQPEAGSAIAARTLRAADPDLAQGSPA